MNRSLNACLVLCALLLTAFAAQVQAQSTAAPEKSTTPQEKSATSQEKKPAQSETKVTPPGKTFTAEQIAESTIFVFGSRPVLAQIRRNGVERGRITRVNTEGKTEEATYERRFVRGESSEKDKIRLDQKMPTMEYSLIYGDGRLWGLINGTAFTPRPDTANTFLSQQKHSIDTLLRYKENGSTLNLVGKDKQKGLDLYVLDLIDKDKLTTRYYISAKSLHVLWLEYDEAPAAGATSVHYTRKFFDYRYAQSTLVPYRTVLLEEGKQTQESRILTVTFGIKLDDELFKNPEA
ncbi:MAG TPA: hypothetical protein VIV66_16740 [Pyrinomonadaceae bacterium]